VEEVLFQVRSASSPQGDEVTVSAVAMAGRVVGYLRAVRVEMGKITWLPWSQLRSETIKVIVIVSIIGVIIGIMDWIFSIVLIQFLGNVAG